MTARDCAARVTDDAKVQRACRPQALPPVLHPSVADLVCGSPGTLLALCGQYGSPFHIVLPEILQQNVDAFCTVLKRHKVRFELFYGAKVNKSPALVRAAVEAGIGVDVSSIYELRDALCAGGDSTRFCGTGPAKTRVFHAALIADRALISVDSLEELDDLEGLAREIDPDHPVRLLVRYRPAGAAGSRFGMAADGVLRCLQRIAGLREWFCLEGFHFHLAGYNHESRAQAVRELVHLVDAARGFGLDPRMIDIGGGLPVRYVDADVYEAFLPGQRADDYRNGIVPKSFYPYGGRTSASEWLDQLLAAPCVRAKSVAGWLNAMGLTLAVEPGRSLVDQAAISVFRVTRVKQLPAGHHVIFAEGSSFSACETWFASEYLVDPILVSARAAQTVSTPVRAYIAGHSCLDEDVITNRLIHFPTRPIAGDLLVYANTAGYQMDLLENEFHRHPMPRRLCARFDPAGRMVISPDEPTENGGMR